MINAPRCSVILPTYNRAETLPRAVASVLAQDEPRLELIIIDDATTDATGTWLASLRDDRIRVISLPVNSGPAEARNHGLRAAMAPVTAFLDSDDVYRANRLSVPLEALAGDAELVCVISSSVKQVRTKTAAVVLPDLKLASPVFEWAMFCDLVGVETSSITVRTEAALACGGFRAALRRTEDREFMIRLAKLGALRVLGDILWDKSWSDDSLSNSWLTAGESFMTLLAERPEYVQRFSRLGNYFAVKILVSDLRHRSPATFYRDYRRFHGAGLLRADLRSLWRGHREVRNYRRAMSGSRLAQLSGAPQRWD